MKIKHFGKKEMGTLSGLAVLEENLIYLNKDNPKPVQRFVLEHEKFHLRDYKKLKILGKKQSLFMWELKTSIYAFAKHPLDGIYMVFRCLYPPRLISSVKFYFFNNEEKTNKMVRKLKKLK